MATFTGYRAPAVCRAVGITYRELDNWVRRGAVSPSLAARGSGTQRLFSLQDLQDVALVASLRNAGVPLQRCAAAVAMAHHAQGARWVVLEGRSAQVVTAGSLEAALAACDGAVVVDLEAVRNVAAPLVESTALGPSRFALSA